MSKETHTTELSEKEASHIADVSNSTDYVKISECSDRAGALFLIEQHTIGNLRDEADLDNAKYHAQQTANFIEDLLLNIDGTIEEKIEFI